ncbi:hypothetical protein L1987_59749 [Smallanthus sonchifolius]|uniref:Uncharacterized protein n=1 Tax=Smallanthus sonchifolius TaxID=185202 RepID=A0ACB9D658_9ASTR|nr:hypothetical protein L1987_59749 [Smallanthus sonchifolius]
MLMNPFSCKCTMYRGNNIILFLWVLLLRFLCGFGCLYTNTIIHSIFSLVISKNLFLHCSSEFRTLSVNFFRDLQLIVDDEKKCMKKMEIKSIDVD